MRDPDSTVSRVPWYQVAPERLAEERSLLEARGFSLDEGEMSRSNLVVFKGVLADFPDRFLRIIFPHAYPSLAPIVCDDGKCPLLPRHQKAQGRVYCLFGPEGKNWSADQSGTDALDQCSNLISDYLSPGKLPPSHKEDPYPEPASLQSVFAPEWSVLVPPDVCELLPRNLGTAAEGRFSLILSAQGNASGKGGLARGVVVDARFKDGKGAACKSIYRQIAKGKSINGFLVFLPSLPSPIFDQRTLKAHLDSYRIHLPPSFSWYAVIFPEESGKRGVQRYSWLAFHAPRKGFLVPVRTTTYRSADRQVRIPGLDWLNEKRVAIIGCGAVGSKIAASLAASGVRRFMLVDRESMEPGNSVRHECGVEYFSLPKAQALANRIVSLNPDAAGEIESFCFDPFSIGPAQNTASFLDRIESSHLIVNATGHGGISRFLNGLGSELGVPTLHASVTNGAWSGEVVRSIPNRTACWQCWLAEYGEVQPPGEPMPEERLFAPGCDQPTFTGTTFDIGNVANLAASFAIDTMRVVDGCVSEFEGDYLLWEGRNAEGRPKLKATIMPVTSRGEKCSWCGPKP